jgi:alpha-amylase/alpha-mannosidase (GH57 family)
MKNRKLNVVLCWHMHQPDYRKQGRYTRPWTWLHAIKDYSDMAAHLENVPGARAVVNFSPVLILQLEDYGRRIARLLSSGRSSGDDTLDALGGLWPQTASGTRKLMQQCLRSQDATIKRRFADYARLCQRAEQVLADDQALPRQELWDLLGWYCIAWLGESVRCDSPLAGSLARKAGRFTAADLRGLLALTGEVITGLLPRYRRLAEEGIVELSVTPFSHPILPLLLDFSSAREAMPEVELPETGYPGGEQRCHWQIERALEVFERSFGFRPAGCWPSEGGVSESTLALLSRYGFAWAASGTRVLRNSLANGEILAHCQPWRQAPDIDAPGAGTGEINCFFRDDDISDAIGFTYSQWEAEDAVNDLVRRLEHVFEHLDHVGTPTLSIIMDGENAWEFYRENGAAFLEAMYSKLAAHPHIELTTFADILAGPVHAPCLPALTAGSWVYGNFSVWIGHPAKNRAWEYLVLAKGAVDEYLGRHDPGPERREDILLQLAHCESSDWFWWLGEAGREEDGPAFDALFRQQLKSLYEMIGSTPPGELDRAISPWAKPKMNPPGRAARCARRIQTE